MIDGVLIRRQEGGTTTILQQMCMQTGGNYQEVMDVDMLKTILISGFLPSKEVREIVKTTMLAKSILTSSCYCCDKPVEIGLTCSYCLTLYCKARKPKKCGVCKTQFQQV